ncbi:hypothetical protein K2X05_07960 [bacterium]|nr:hypothetical protein [bacterium]
MRSRWKSYLLGLGLLCSPSVLWAETLQCIDFFQKQTPKWTEFRIEYNGSNTFQILRKINRVFNEYPREYMENSKTVAKVTIPESRWQEVFGQDYFSVINELSKAEIYKTEIYEDGTQSRVFDVKVLIAFRNDEIKNFPNEWIPQQKSYSFEFDRRILRLMEILEEPAHVGYVLENGIIASNRWTDYY